MRVKEGYKFSEALKEFPESFDSLYVSLIEAGESSGELGNVMEETADYLEKEQPLIKRSLEQQYINGFICNFPSDNKFIANLCCSKCRLNLLTLISNYHS